MRQEALRLFVVLSDRAPADPAPLISPCSITTRPSMIDIPGVHRRTGQQPRDPISRRPRRAECRRRDRPPGPPPCPASRLPMSSRPRTAAPPRVASSSASRAEKRSARDSNPGQPTRCSSIAWRASPSNWFAVVARRTVDAEANAHAAIAHLAYRRDARGEDHVAARAVADAAQGLRPADRFRRRSGAPCARTRRRRRSSPGSAGRAAAACRTAPRRSGSRRWFRPDGYAAARPDDGVRAAAVLRINSGVTLNGEQGARPMRSIDSGSGSWNSAMTRSQSASIAASSSQTLSGGRPPWLWPRLMLPRVG